MKFLGVTLCFAVLAKSFCHKIDVPGADVSSNPSRPLASSLAIGGMVQGLLDMQIRPQGGFFEEKYKTIFSHDAAPLPSPNTLGKHYTSSGIVSSDRISEDGKLLKEASIGESPNPCFEADRILYNPLLGLLCKLQQRNAWNT